MGTNPGSISAIAKIIHLGAENEVEFHIAPGERVVFAGPTEFAVVFPVDSPFNERVFTHAHSRSLPARQCEGRFQYYWARGGLVGMTAKPLGVEVTGVFGPTPKEGAEGPPKGGTGVIIVS